MKYCLLYLTLLVITLAGCTPSEEDATNRQAPAAVPAQALQSPTIITFGALEEHRTTYQPLIEAFNNSQSALVVRFVPLDSVFDATSKQSSRQQTRAIAQSVDTAAPFAFGTPADQALAFRNLSPFVDGDSSFEQADYLPTALQRMPDGALYRLPQTISVPTLSYNKTLWKARGLKTPTATWQWADMRLAALRLTNRANGTVRTYGMLDQGDGTVALAGELMRLDSKILNRPLAEVQINATWNTVVLGEVYSLVDQGALYMSENQSVYLNTFNELIRSGAVGMWPTGLLPKSDGLSFDVGTAVYPAMPLPFFRSDDGYVMSSGTQHAEAAWQWLAFLSRQVIVPEQAIDFTLAVPARASVAEQSGYWQQIGPEAAAAVRATLARPALDAPALATSVWWLRTPLHHIIFDSGIPSQELDKAQVAYQAARAEGQADQLQVGVDPVVVATPQPDTPPGLVRIVFAATTIDARLLRNQVERFQRQYPDIVVDVQNQSTSDASIAQRAITADCFDLVGLPSANDRAVLLDLQPLVNADARGLTNDIPPALMQLYQQDGRLYALPHAVSFRVLAYNVHRFDQAGLPYPTAQWSMLQLRATADTLQQRAGPNAYGFAQHSGSSGNVVLFLDLAGATAVRGSQNDLTVDFTNPLVITTLTSYIDLLKADSPHTRLTGYARNDSGISNVVQQIVDGNIGMWIESTAGLPTEQVQASVRAAPLPFAGKALPVGTIGATGLAISAQSPNAQACWNWLTFLNEDTSVIGNGFPARTSLLESAAFQQTVLPGAVDTYKTYLTAMQQAIPPSDNGQLLSFDSPLDSFWFFRAVDRALQGGNLTRELAEAQANTSAFLDCTRNGTAGSICAKQVDATYDGWRNATP